MMPTKPKSCSATSKKTTKIPLGADFIPDENCVLCGRGKMCTTSTGNRRLKSLVQSYIPTYSDAQTKIEKSNIVSTIIASIKATGGTFVRYDKDQWYKVDDAFAREKVGCIFRDCLYTQYRSSTKSKLARRKEAVCRSRSNSISTPFAPQSPSNGTVLSEETVPDAHHDHHGQAYDSDSSSSAYSFQRQVTPDHAPDYTGSHGYLASSIPILPNKPAPGYFRHCLAPLKASPRPADTNFKPVARCQSSVDYARQVVEDDNIMVFPEDDGFSDDLPSEIVDLGDFLEDIF